MTSKKNLRATVVKGDSKVNASKRLLPDLEGLDESRKVFRASRAASADSRPGYRSHANEADGATRG